MSSSVKDVFEHLPEPPDLRGKINVLSDKPIYTGPYSRVYRGVLKKGCRKVAVVIKVLHEITGLKFESMLRKLERERRTWSSLRHRNILPLYGLVDDGDLFQPFGALVSPWLKRGDASVYLEEHGSSMTISQRINLWRGVVAGVNYLHSHNPQLIHGDLKPRNILIDDSGNAQICDFGLVRIFLDEGSSGMTTTSLYTGTERYLARELIVSEDEACPTTASDVYAVGCIGLEFIFLQTPYSACKNHRGGSLYQHIRAGDLPAQCPPDLTPTLEFAWALLVECWARDPHKRPRASSLLAWLEIWKSNNLLGQLPVVGSLEEPTPKESGLNSLGSPKKQRGLTQPDAQFALWQHAALKRIFDYQHNHPDTSIPASLVTYELAEVEGDHGWCLIGICGIERITQKAALSGRSEDSPHKGLAELFDHIHGKHILGRSNEMSTLSMLVRHVELCDTIRLAIPQTFEMLTDDDDGVRAAAVSALPKLAQHAELRDAIRAAIPQIVEMFKDVGNKHTARSFESSAAVSAAISVLPELAQHAELRDAIRVAIPQIFELHSGVGVKKPSNEYMFDYEPPSASPATPVVEVLPKLPELAQHAEFRDAIRATIPQIVEMFKDVAVADADYGRRFGVFRQSDTASPTSTPASTIASVLTKLAEHAELLDATRLAIPQIVELLRHNSPDVQAAAASTLPILAERVEHRDAIHLAIPLIVKMLTDKHDGVRVAAVSTLPKLAQHAEFRDAIHVAIPHIIEMFKDVIVVNEHNNGYMYDYGQSHAPSSPASDIASVLTKLAEHAYLRSEIRQAIPRIIELLRHSVSDVQAAAVSALPKLAEHSELRDSICLAIPQIVELLWHNDSAVQKAAASALPKLTEHADFCVAICAAIPQVFEMFRDAVVKDPNHESMRDDFGPPRAPSPASAVISVLPKLAEYADLRDEIRLAIPQIVELLRHNVSSVQRAAALAFPILAEHTELRDAIHLAVPRIVKMLTDKNAGVRVAAVSAFPKLAEYAEYRDAIRLAISRIIVILWRSETLGQAAAASSLAELSEHGELRDEIRQAIPQIVELLRCEVSEVQAAAATALHKLAEHAELRDSIYLTIPRIVGMLMYDSLRVRAVAVSALPKLAEHAELRDTIRLAIPQITEMFNNGVVVDDFPDNSMRFMYSGTASPASDAALAIASVLPKLAEHAEIRDAIRLAIPQIVELLRHNDAHVQAAATSALPKLAEHAELRDAICLAIPQIVEILTGDNASVRAATFSALPKLAEHAEFRDAMGVAIPPIADMFKDDVVVKDPGNGFIYPEVEQSRAASSTAPDIASVLPKLAEHAEIRDAIRLAIPQIVQLLRRNVSDVRVAAALALPVLAEHSELRDAIHLAFPQIVEMLTDDNANVRAAAVSALPKLAQHADPYSIGPVGASVGI